jgi:hypothetical protein
MELNNRVASSSRSDQLIKETSCMSAMDQRYLEMVQLVHLLGSAFVSPHFWKGDNALDNTLDQLVQSLNQLAQIPGKNGGIFIRETTAYGNQLNKNVARYTIQFSNIILNTEVAAEVARRSNTSATQILRKLQIAFDIFSLIGIHDLYLRIFDGSKDNLERIRISLEILSHFDQAVQSGTDIIYHLKDQSVTLPVIKGLHDQADPNLTMVAALNQLSAADMEEIKKWVTAYIEQHLTSSAFKDKYNLFTVMFCIKDLKESLILPPLEINNTKFRLTASEIETGATMDKTLKKTFDKHQNIESFSNNDRIDASASEKEDFQKVAFNGDGKKNQETHILELTKPINDRHQTPPGKTNQDTKIIATNNHSPSESEEPKPEENADKDDEPIVHTDSVVNKIDEINHLLDLLENTVLKEEILDSIIVSLKEYLQRVPKDGVDGVESVESDLPSKKIGKFHSHILRIFSRFTDYSKKETKTFSSSPKRVVFKCFDHEQIAEQFDLTISETQKIVQILEKCFDPKGHFIRFEFENKIPDFIVFESKIFKFLWAYLDEYLHRKDRVAFFNSLYHLISNMNQPQEVLFLLLDELYKNPSKISYRDRNAFMLVSLLLRNYNKECSVDIELTPGEVLLVKDGLNENILQFASKRIEADKDLIKEKLDTIHNRLISAFNDQKTKSITWAPHFLLSLEREAFIFLSLVAGETARQILISALSRYGNPKSEIYGIHHQKRDLALLLQQLKLLIRALGRVGDIEDLGLLADLKKSENEFSLMHASSHHRKNVCQIFSMIDIAMGNITSLP